MRSKMRGRWFITPHARDQYISRVHPELTKEEAFLVLCKVSELAHRVKEVSPNVFLYRGPKPERLNCVVCVSTDDVRERPQLLTVYQGPDPEWQEISRRIKALSGEEPKRRMALDLVSGRLTPSNDTPETKGGTKIEESTIR